MRTAAFLLSLTVMFVAFGASGPLHAQSSTTGLHKAEDKSVTVPSLDITVDDLEDMDIYSADNEKIGEVDDVLVDSSAKPVAVSAEVGGFLGLGEKDVVIDLSQFTKDGDHLRTSMTKEQIKELPEMDD
ncbi:MAG: PRC-barrel domain-containing protein [Geminicoccaceae bacterium]